AEDRAPRRHRDALHRGLQRARRRRRAWQDRGRGPHAPAPRARATAKGIRRRGARRRAEGPAVMNDDRLVGMLSALRTERMERTADQVLRARLENAWTVREAQSGLGWRLRRPVLVVATAALVFGSIATTLSAPGDSALYTLRVTIEDL